MSSKSWKPGRSIALDLRLQREGWNLKVREVAAVAGIPESTDRNYENERTTPDATVIRKLARALAVRLAPSGGATKVTWTMEGDVVSMMPRILAGWFKLMTGRMIGKQFARGLATLKGQAVAA